MVVVAVHARRWSKKELAAHLKRHRRFFIGGPPRQEGVAPGDHADTLKKVKEP